MNNSLDILETHRDALLLVAAGALLHNLGKVTRQFLEWQITEEQSEPGQSLTTTEKSKYLYQHILHLIETDIDSMPQEARTQLWVDYSNLAASEDKDILDATTIALLTNRSIKLPQPLDDRDYSPGDLLEYLGQGGDDWYELQERDKEQNDNTQQKGKFKIEELFTTGSRLTHLMNRSHRAASGGEKHGIAFRCQKNPNDLYIATPFGWETKALDVTNIDDLKKDIEACINKYLPSLIDLIRYKEFRNKLKPLLRKATADTRRPLNDVTVADIGLTGAAFLLSQVGNQVLRGLPRSKIGHAEFAEPQKGKDGKDGKVNSLFWCVLSLRTDGIGYLNSAPTLADVRVRRKRFDKALKNLAIPIRNYMVMQEIFRDENGIFYLVPDFTLENSENYKALLAILKPTIEIDGLIFTTKLSPRLVSHPDDIGDQDQYVGDYIVAQLSQDSIPTNYNFETFEGYWNGSSRHKVCPACGVRPQIVLSDREKEEGRAAICDNCKSDRKGVAEDWLETTLDSTIWLDEVADINGRFALVVSQWELEKFLPKMFYPAEENPPKQNKDYCLEIDFIDGRRPQDGTRFSSLSSGEFYWCVTEGGAKWRGCLTDEKKQDLLGIQKKEITINIPGKQNQNNKIEGIESIGKDFILLLAKPLAALLVGEKVTIWGQGFEVFNTNKVKTVTPTASKKIIEILFWEGNRFPFRISSITEKEVPFVRVEPRKLVKNSSFARVQRAWETTQQFWTQMVEGYKAENGDPEGIKTRVGQVQPRLEIELDNTNGIRLEDHNAYELVCPNSDLSVSALWDKSCQRFVLIDNLEYLAKLLDKDVREALIGQVKIATPTGYGSNSKVLGTIEVKQEHISEIPHSGYTPVINILAEPRTFMALVPADKALEVAKAIQAKYETEMGKVRNRLPLNLGIVFAGRRTPLSSVLDAGRRMLKQPNQAEPWKVESVVPIKPGPNNWPKKVELTLEKAGQKLTLDVPTVMGDGSTQDVWYPYWQVISDANGVTPVGRERQFIGPEPEKTIWVHVCDLVAGDTVCLLPSRFDFEYLDTAARRFEISYEDGKRRVLQNAPAKARPYYLEQVSEIADLWEILSNLTNGLHNTQIKDLDAIIERKRLEWHDQAEFKIVFEAFVENVIENVQWKKAKNKYQDGKAERLITTEQIKKIKAAAKSGMLSDVIELYTEILKQKTKVDEEAEKNSTQEINQ